MERIATKRIEIKKAIIDRGMSCLQAAWQLGVSPSQLSMVVNGWRTPSEVMRNRLLEIFPDLTAEAVA